MEVKPVGKAFGDRRVPQKNIGPKWKNKKMGEKRTHVLPVRERGSTVGIQLTINEVISSVYVAVNLTGWSFAIHQSSPALIEDLAEVLVFDAIAGQIRLELPSALTQQLPLSAASWVDLQGIRPDCSIFEIPRLWFDFR